MAQTRRYKYNRRIHVNLSWKPKNSQIACTNNLSVFINAGHKMVTKTGLVRTGMKSYPDYLLMSWDIAYSPIFCPLRPMIIFYRGINGTPMIPT